MTRQNIALISIRLTLLLPILAALAHVNPVIASDWVTYSDPRYGLLIDHPTDWTITPAADTAGSYGAVITFSPAAHAASVAEVPTIVVGLRTVELSPSEKLSGWADRYQQASQAFAAREVSYSDVENIQATQKGVGELRYARVQSPLGAFSYIDVASGRLVWFVWTNAPDLVDPILRRMAASLRPTGASPATLQAAFGTAYASDTSQRSTARSSAMADGPVMNVVGLPTSNWIVPVPSGTSYTVNCGSPYHTGTAAYAADIATPMRTRVYSTNRSWVDFAGWDNTGYGNLVKTNTDRLYAVAYTSYYAHLDSFLVSPGQQVWTATQIAYSGTTGTTAIHLHFHIRTASDAVNLANLVSFAENANYPSVYAACGTMSR